MTRINKGTGKRGFTLVELMLAIAIVTIISGLFVALLLGIKDSYVRVYNSNDSADYAMLFAQGFENSFLGYTQDQTNKDKCEWYVKDSILYVKVGSVEKKVFEPKQLNVQTKTGGTTKVKWKIDMTYEYDGDNTVTYHIKLYDNYYDPHAPLTAQYDSSFTLLHFTTNNKGKITEGTGNTSIFYEPNP